MNKLPQRGRFLTFRSAPQFETDKAGKAVFVGVPLETGAERWRMGSSLAPNHVRLQSMALNRFGTFISSGSRRNDFDPVDQLGLTDWGDVLLSGDLAQCQETIRSVFASLSAQGLRTISVGGDGSVTLPQLQGLASVWGPLAVLHLDAHTDANPLPGPGAANCFHLATLEGVLLPEATVHLGVRGHVMRGDILAHVAKLGHTVIHMDDWTPEKAPQHFANLQTLFSGLAVYVCVDLDVVDPSAAPGVVSPSWGGLSVRELLTLLRSLAWLDIVAVDINTTNPLFDTQGTTAHLCASLVLEGLHLFAHSHPKRRECD